jgi:carbamoyltransferase
MATVLGLNAVFHDPAAALVIDGRIVAAAEEERFNRRKHGKVPVPFSTWELPENAARWCLERAGIEPDDLGAVAYSYDPELAPTPDGPSADAVVDQQWEGLRTLFVRRAPRFVETCLPGLAPAALRYVPHHVAHAASAYHAAPFSSSATMVLDGRGESSSYLAGVAVDGALTILATQSLPHSLGLVYEAVTDHLGFVRSSDEYKVMALASYGSPSFIEEFRLALRTTGDGGFRTDPIALHELVPRRDPDGPVEHAHADLASSLQHRLEEVLLELADWLHTQTGMPALTMAGGVALNCVANSRIHRESSFRDVWVQPAAGDAGTALGAALWVAHDLGDRVEPMDTAALGSAWTDEEIEAELRRAAVPFERPAQVADAVGEALAGDRVVAWFQGSSEFGPRALGHRSLLADPRPVANLERLNDIKGREQFRPVAPMVTLDRAADVFEGPVPSPYMLFVHRVRDEWRDRIPTVVHVDGTARIQTVDRNAEPLMAAVIDRFAALTGVPVVVNTSLNTAGRPMVDSPRDALECFGSSPIDVLAIGPFVVRRRDLFAA